MTKNQVSAREQGFAHLGIVAVFVVVLGVSSLVVFRQARTNDQKNAVQDQKTEQQKTDSIALEKATKLAEEKKKIEEAKKAEEAAKQPTPAPAPAPAPAPVPSKPRPSSPSSAAYNSPMDNFEQLDPEVAYVVNPSGAKIYAGYFTDEVVKTLPYGTKLKVHRQDGRAAVDGVAGEPAEADWAIDPKDVRRSL